VSHTANTGGQTAPDDPSVVAAAAGPSLADADGSGHAPDRRRQRVPEFAALLVVLIVLCVFFAIRSPYFLSGGNFVSILEAIAVTGIIAVPGTMLIIAGQFDLSVGSGAAFCGVVMASLAAPHGILMAVVITLVVGMLIGAVNGFLVTVVGVNALITTLGMLSALAGLAQVRAGGQTVLIEHFTALGTARPIASVPIPVIVYVIVAVVGAVLMRYTVFGRSLYAIGANPVAARLVGIRARKALFLTFVASGVAVAVGGLILTSQLGAASPNAATGMELSVITAIVLGGASLSGGRGTVLGTIIGLIIIGVLNNGLVLLNVDSFYQDVARGVLLIFAVSFDQLRQRFAKS
jgi:ribose transport system permease protein